MSNSEQCSNRLELDLISLLVNFSYELGQIMARFDFLWPRWVIVSNHVQTDFQLCIIDHVLLDSGALRPKGLLFHNYFVLRSTTNVQNVHEQKQNTMLTKSNKCSWSTNDPAHPETFICGNPDVTPRIVAVSIKNITDIGICLIGGCFQCRGYRDSEAEFKNTLPNPTLWDMLQVRQHAPSDYSCWLSHLLNISPRSWMCSIYSKHLCFDCHMTTYFTIYTMS